MPTAFDEIAAGLADLRDSCGGVVTYRTPAGEVGSVNAIKSLGRRDQIGPDGAAQITFEPVIWQVKYADLVIATKQVKPSRGHLIIDGDGSQYELDYPGGGDVYYFMDSNRTTVKLISKRVK